MKILNVFVFLYSISVTALIIPSLVPKTSMILLFLILFSLVLNLLMQTYNKVSEYKSSICPVFYTTYSNFIYLITPIIILLAWVVTLSFDENANKIAYIGMILVHSTFLLFIIITRAYTFLYLKSYIYLVFIMSLLGVLASLLFSLGILDFSGHYVNLNEMTHGSFSRDENFGEESYLFPYGLGLILVESGKLSLFGMEFYRISGWAHEPTSATLFIAPAIILLIHGNIFKNGFFKYLMLLTIVIFWLLAMSVGSLLAFLVLYGLLTLYFLYTRLYPLKSSLTVLLLISIALIAIIAGIDLLLNSTIFTTKFNLESETMRKAINELLWFVPGSDKTMIFYFSHLFLWSLIGYFLMIVSVSVLFLKYFNVYVLILFYLVLHSMKGSQENVFILVFTFYWLYLALFSLESNKNFLNLNRKSHE